MRTLNFHCRYCNVTTKILLEDVELTPDGALVEGICEKCFEDYQKEGLKTGLEEVPQCPDPHRSNAA
jgi:hypothetical protein